MIAVDRLSAEELNALGAYELGHAMNEVLESVAECGRLQRASRSVVADAKIAVLRAETPEQRKDALVTRIEAEAQLSHIRDRAATLRHQSSILQSLLRAAVIV